MPNIKILGMRSFFQRHCQDDAIVEINEEKNMIDVDIHLSPKTSRLPREDEAHYFDEAQKYKVQEEDK